MSSCGVCVCVCVCVSVTFVDCVKTNKDIFEIFSLSSSHTILVFPYQTGWRYSDGIPLTGASNAGRVGRNRDSEPTCLLLTLQQARCCKHGRQWTTATISQVVTIYRWLYMYTAGIRPPSATRDKVTVSVVLQRESDQARSRTIHNIVVGPRSWNSLPSDIRTSTPSFDTFKKHLKSYLFQLSFSSL